MPLNDEQLIYSQGAVALMKKEEHIKHYVSSLNLNPTEFDKVTGMNRWLTTELTTLQPTLDKIIYGSATATGASRESFTAEWVAMMIVTLVAPFNWHDACMMQSNLSYSSDVIKQSQLGLVAIEQNVNHRLLFALCTTFITNVDGQVFRDFQKSVRDKLRGQSK